MAVELTPVRPGQKITASLYNSLVAQANAINKTLGLAGIVATPPLKALTRRRDCFVSMAHNNTSVDYMAYEPALLSGQVYGHDDPALQGQVVMEFVEALPSTDRQSLVVTLEGIPANGVGRVASIGTCLCFVQGAIGDDSITTAQLQSTVTTTHTLELNENGNADIVWRDDSGVADITVPHLAMVRFPSLTSPGEAGLFAFYIRANKTALNALLPAGEPAFGYTTSGQRYYALSDGNWISISHIEDVPPP
jgi:hypothetical protein